jgi:prolipoprotein diacylglyceryl transferase
MQPLAYIPSPSQGIWHIGPVPIRAYAIMIILGIVAAVWLGERRWAAKGGTPGVIVDVAVWAVPFGLVGGRIYHVLTDYQLYFGEDGDPARALEIWQGGLGIWGAVAFGAVGALIGCRRRGISIFPLADAVAPGIALAQAIGRWGNYWNQELYGRPLDTFWALKIDEDHRPMLEGGPGLDPRYADVATYHPTFLYESLWCIGVAVLVIWADRRFKLTHGRAFALYVAAYTLGRAWIETLRIDEAHHVLGLRLNAWTSIILFLAAVAYLYQARNRTGPENVGGPADGPSDPAGPAEEKKDAPKDEPDTGKEPEAAAGDEESEAKNGTGPEDEAERPDPGKPGTGEAADEEKPAPAGDEKAEEPGDERAEQPGEDRAESGDERAESGDGTGEDGAGDAGRVAEGEPVKDGK